MRVGTILQFIGGRLVGVALSGVIIGIFVLVVAATPAQFIASFFQHSPTWLISPWFSPSFTIFGDDLVNRTPRPQTDGDIEKWKKDYEAWCDKVNKKLENRAFFTSGRSAAF
jgi:hypothetical protein